MDHDCTAQNKEVPSNILYRMPYFVFTFSWCFYQKRNFEDTKRVMREIEDR